MIIHHADRAIVKWAIDNGYPYEYRREYGLPAPCLCVKLGVSNAFFKSGLLVQWQASARATGMDQLMFELSTLHALCAQEKAYPAQDTILAPQERWALREPRRRDSA